MATRSSAKVLPLSVTVKLEDAKGELPDATLSAFDQAGQLLTSVRLKKTEQNDVKLQLPAHLDGRNVRLLVGPTLPESPETAPLPKYMEKLLENEPEQKKSLSLNFLQRRGAYEKLIRVDAESKSLRVSIPAFNWVEWLLCSCFVKGRVVKRVKMPDGSTMEMGVCYACVKIYEVDKFLWIIMRLLDEDLFRLRDDLWRVIVKGPWPPPPPNGYHLPHEIIKTVKPMAAMHKAGSTSTAETGLSAGTEAENKAQIQADLQPIFAATSAVQLRAALMNNAMAIVKYVCHIPWLFYHYHKDLIKCVCTDAEGHFETRIWYLCSGDKPDLYFRVLQCIGGTLFVLYDPGMVCHTHWNYQCGTEVVLEVTDPAARVCVPPPQVDPPPGVQPFSPWVMPSYVGNIRLDKIKSFEAPTFDDFGKTIWPEDGGWPGVVFGGRLELQHTYSNTIPVALGAPGPYYYRWLYCKLTDATHQGEWKELALPVAEAVIRHYADEDTAHPEKPPTFPAYLLGPKTVTGIFFDLFEFKPHQPPQTAGHNCYWPSDTFVGETATGIVQSLNLPAGKYKIRLEVYDSGGNNLKPILRNADGSVAVPGAFDFIVPCGDDGTTILARHVRAEEMEIRTKDAKDYYGLVFFLHIDNSPCEAEIYDASVNGVQAGPCGFIGFQPGNIVRLSFRAFHPNGFARFKFTIAKGSSNYVEDACCPAYPGTVAWSAAPLVTETNPNSYLRSGSDFARNLPVVDVLGTCPEAAFGENLYVAAAVTNGFTRLSGLDAFAIPKAFALKASTPESNK